jgi:hypothetical protein
MRLFEIVGREVGITRTSRSLHRRWPSFSRLPVDVDVIPVIYRPDLQPLPPVDVVAVRSHDDQGGDKAVVGCLQNRGSRAQHHSAIRLGPQ